MDVIELNRRLTNLLNKNFGCSIYKWIDSPTAVLKGKSAHFIFKDQKKTWQGKISIKNAFLCVELIHFSFLGYYKYKFKTSIY